MPAAPWQPAQLAVYTVAPAAAPPPVAAPPDVPVEPGLSTAYTPVCSPASAADCGVDAVQHLLILHVILADEAQHDRAAEHEARERENDRPAREAAAGILIDERQYDEDHDEERREDDRGEEAEEATAQLGALPTTSSSENSAMKYQAGYGTNCVLFGSALASSGAGEKTASKNTMTNIANDTTVSMNIWSGQKRPGLSFGASSIGAPAGPFQRKIMRCKATSAISTAGVSQTWMPKKRLIVSVPMPEPSCKNSSTAWPGDRCRTRDLNRDFGCEQCIEIPRQQVAGETEHERDDEQDDADDPLQFARLLVRAPQQNLEHVHHHECDHRRRAPIVEREDELTGGNLLDDVLRRFPRGCGGRRVVERQEDTGRNLHEHREHGRAAESVPVASAAGDVLGEEVPWSW